MSALIQSDLNLKGVNLYLIGMMGAGKSTVGKQLAERLNYHFFDTDQLIEQLAGQPVSAIFAEAGEAEFRRLETQVLAELSSYRNLAIATGGGIVLEQMNWSYLQHGVVVWLDAPLTLLWSRLQSDSTRPLLQTADPVSRLAKLLSERERLYAQADVRVPISVDNSVEQVAELTLHAIQAVLKAPPMEQLN